ncbi:MAG: iron chelate uptake ABC transporter family permease subunit [Thiomargarita sp.]|nr:iron chelate uptake ABC transporter family permease subunit [Thiomargarita sp.]
MLRLKFIALFILVIIVALIAITVGSINIPFFVVIKILLANILPNNWIETQTISQTNQVVVWLIRTPRIIVAALVGAALAMAGAQMQGLFQNPLASPGIIGTSSGGALGAVIILATGLASHSILYIPIFAFIGALLSLFTVYMLATERGQTSIATLLLAGIAVNALINALTSFIITFSWLEYEISREMVFWLMGGLDNRTWSHVWMCLPGIFIGGFIALLYTRELDILLMGSETASSLGVEVEKVKLIILTSAALLTGTAVAVSGVVSFVGLVIPHIVRLIIGPKHRYLIPACALTGAIFVILTDLLARTLNRPEEIRLGILTAIFGAPFFLYLLLKQRRKLNYL